MGPFQRALVAVLLLALPAAAQLRSHPAPAEAPEFQLNENGCLGGRVLDYLERHGDFGRIDPEALLYVTRIEHERRVFEGRAPAAEGISGSVWSSIGPTNGAGRATAIAIHPTAQGTAVIGAAGGGAWKTTNRGQAWTPLTESIPNLSVGAIAYAPSDPNRLYLGTGEGGYAADFIPGIGLLTSADGGTTWTLPEEVLASMFYRISVHPANPDEIVVGTNRGALRSTTGANGPWTTVLPANRTSGGGYGDVADIVRDVSNPAVLYAATWDRGRWCARNACAPAVEMLTPTILKSVDGGVTWSAVMEGFPQSTAATRVERVSLAIAPSSPNTLYALTALFDAESGVTRSHVFKTVNGGESWSPTGLSTSADARVADLLGTQGWYDNTIVVSPGDPNLVIAGGITYARTTDGGATWSDPFTGRAPHVDAHDLRYDPLGILWIANDGGIWTSPDHATTVTECNEGLVTRQYYALSLDRVNRNRILAGTQDNGTNRRTDAGGTAWSAFSGGDGFHSLVHPNVPAVAYSTYQFAEVLRSKSASSAAPLLTPSGPVFETDEKKPFFSVLKADPNNGSVLYLGSTRVWKSVSGGEAWVPLSTNTTGARPWNENTIRAIAIAPGNPATLMVAKGNAIYRTTDGGVSWTEPVNNGLPGRTVTNIEISPDDPDTAYATLAGTSGAPVYFTSNGGSRWNARSSGLPPFSALVLRFDPTDPSTLYAGTDVGVYRSTDRGVTWTPFGTGMPAVSVYDVQILGDGSIVRAATHGRGIWELAVNGAVNSAPVVAVAEPVPAAISVSRGSVVHFGGLAADPDNGALTVRWTFSDDWSSSSGRRASHRFDRPGTWPVSFTATDPEGAVGGDEVTVVVKEPGDDCATPLVIPPAGPFPWSVTFDSEVTTAQHGSEPLSGGSCYPFSPQRTTWLSFTPEVSGIYTVSLCTSRVAGFIAAYTGPACGPHVAAAMCVANTRLSGRCSEDPTDSMELTAGVEYRFFAGSYYSNSFGPITVTIERGDAIPAAIRSVVPATGALAGGTKVVLTGSGFAEGATVTFDGVEATAVTVLSPGVISAVAPPHGAGDVDVAVQVGATTATSFRAFTYADPPPPAGRRRAARH
jgi:photosystem II stability/assembly factor-like uncharacterized protein